MTEQIEDQLWDFRLVDETLHYFISTSGMMKPLIPGLGSFTFDMQGNRYETMAFPIQRTTGWPDYSDELMQVRSRTERGAITMHAIALEIMMRKERARKALMLYVLFAILSAIVSLV